MKKTMKENIVEEMTGKGYRLVGETSGTFSFRKNTNLSYALERLGLTEQTCVVRQGARAGDARTAGYRLHIFVKDDDNKKEEK
ncbi:MAG: hypothetical protein KG029_00640 [Bacteroidetes bacterium]|nr:hypothetical protein [Bacteroidota bacterium]